MLTLLTRRPGSRGLLAVLGPVLLISGLAMPATPAQALQTSQVGIVSDDPVSWTPDVLDGEVTAIEQVGDMIVVGGSFTQVKEKGSSKPTLDRSGLFAFNASTGAIAQTFAPTLDGAVSTVESAGDGTVFVGGRFSYVNGRVSRKLTRLDVGDGKVASGFAPSTMWGTVEDVRLVGDQIIIVGKFLSVAGDPTRAHMASLTARTGKLTDFVQSSFSVPRKGSLSVEKIDVTPDGATLVAIGNFSVVDGQSRPQLVVFDLTGEKAVVADWATPFYAVNKCSASFWSYMRDVDIDPAGEYFVVTTTGAYGGAESPCDVEARFEIDASGTSVAPSWRAYTGGDTTYAVAISGSAVYVGGHMRWMNNPWAGDKVGAGAVDRPGIAALDPKSGIPFSWNPGREPRGVGVFDMLATDKGLWIGSDTDWVAGEQHRKLAFFPLAGGADVPKGKVGSLPNDVHLLGSPGSSADSARRQKLTTTGIEGPLDVTTGSVNGPSDLSSVRGATLIDDKVFTAWSDGTFKSHPFDGVSLGAPEDVDLHGSPTLPGAANWFGTDAAKVTGMFFDPADNRLYYTMTGDSNLYWRGFTTESKTVGAAKFKATGDVSALAPVKVNGMFMADGRIYFADSATGQLRSVGFTAGRITGPSILADSSIDWRSRGVFLWNGEPTAPAADPVAEWSVECAGLVCAFDGTASSDADGRVDAWAWDFGDGKSGTRSDVQHTFASAGTYDVTLTVTDNRGNTGVKATQVAVSELPNSAVAFRAAASSNGNVSTARVSVPAEVVAGDVMLLWVTNNSDASVAVAPSGWTLVGEESRSGLVSRLFSKVADAGAAGSSVSTVFSRLTKVDVTLAAYSGASAGDPVLAWSSALETNSTRDHTSPALPLSSESGLVVAYWSDKSSSTTKWELPAGVEKRTETIGSGSGRVTTATADFVVEPKPNGTVPGVTATADSPSLTAIMWSVALRSS